MINITQHIYIKSDTSKVGAPITNVLTGITQLSWNISTDQMIFTGFNKAGYDIFTIHNPLGLLKDSIILSDASWKNKNSQNKRKALAKAEKEAVNKIENEVEGIVKDMIETEKITAVFRKTSVILSDTSIDITQKVVEELNKKLSDVAIKVTP